MSSVASLLSGGGNKITLDFALGRTRLNASQRSSNILTALVIIIRHRLAWFHCKDLIFLLLLVGSILVHDINLFIGTLLVDFDDVVLPLFHQNISYVSKVASLATQFYLVSNLWILYEQVIFKELLAERNGLDLVERHVDEFGFLVEADIVVADVSAAVVSDPDLKLLL